MLQLSSTVARGTPGAKVARIRSWGPATAVLRPAAPHRAHGAPAGTHFQTTSAFSDHIRISSLELRALPTGPGVACGAAASAPVTVSYTYKPTSSCA
jgi:hypothetical protein